MARRFSVLAINEKIIWMFTNFEFYICTHKKRKMFTQTSCMMCCMPHGNPERSALPWI